MDALKNITADYAAAQAHRRNSERHREAAERARKAGLLDAAKVAMKCAEQEDAMADKLIGTEAV